MKQKSFLLIVVSVVMLLATNGALAAASKDKIIHDAEYYILDAQNGEKWAVEDKELDKKLAELRKKFGTPPNIVHYMWDDQPPMAFGDPIYQKIRGYDTPQLNKLAEDGMIFARMYTEPGCTPSRAAVLTGQNAIRTGTWEIGFPIEYTGFAAENVTMAEVLSQAGYATGFFGKLHLGDIEESYPNNQGFDEAFWAFYNQITSLYNNIGEGANAIIGMKEELLAENPYQLDRKFIQDKAYVFYAEGKKGEQAKEWRNGSKELKDYKDFDIEARKRALAFIRRNAEAKKPFFVAWWPLWTPFIPDPKKTTIQRGMVAENYQRVIEPDIEALRKTLAELGIAENTLIVAMADNGPMTHNPPPGLGMAETIYRGGKGDFLEGGVRVPAQAWWPKTIAPDQIVGDIIHETDLFTTFAKIAGASDYIPTDRIIDGIDLTYLLMEGDTHGRRDYVFIYAGPNLGATVKGNYKRHWISPDPVGEASGIPAAFYFLPSDPREKTPMLVNLIHLKSPFNRMKLRHELWKKKYPDAKEMHGIPWTGIENATPEVQALAKPKMDLKKLPFDPLEYVDHLDQLPFDPNMDPGLGR